MAGKRGEKHNDTDGDKTWVQFYLGVKRLAYAKKTSVSDDEWAAQEKSWKDELRDTLKKTHRQEELDFLNKSNFFGDEKNPSGQVLDGTDALSTLLTKGPPSFQKQSAAAEAEAKRLKKGFDQSEYLYKNYTWKNGKGLQKDIQSLLSDPCFQEATTVKRKQVNGQLESVNPRLHKYVKGRAGQLYKVTDGNGVHYAPADDVGPDTVEVSDKIYQSGGDQVQYESAGSLSHGAYGKMENGVKVYGDQMTDDQWDEIATKGYKDKQGKYIDTWDQLDAARGSKPGTAKAEAEAWEKDQRAKTPVKPERRNQRYLDGVGPVYLDGIWNVIHQNHRVVGAAPEATHEAGGSSQYGSNTVGVGNPPVPLTREKDGTTDDMEADPSTCSTNLFVGGEPTTTIAPPSR